tara:strand:+ start:3978 stop:4604 length:627 start_codon:yes stop_codon:yes gene_type:complete
MDKKLVLLGYSGHAYSVIDAIRSLNVKISGYFDLKVNSRNPYRLDYLGNEATTKLKKSLKENDFFPSIGDGELRAKMVSYIENNGLSQRNIIHRTANISPDVIFEASIFVSSGAIINTLTTVKKGAIINTGAIVEHECSIGEFTHVGPGAVLTGNVTLGHHTFIGANATIIPGIKIGNNVKVGAGSVVIEDIYDNSIYVGNPARKLKK